MDQLSSHEQQQAEIPMPINSSFVRGMHGHGHGHGDDHHHHVQMSHHHNHNHHDPPPSSNIQLIISSSSSMASPPQVPMSNTTNGTTTNNNDEQQQQIQAYNKKKVVIRFRECQKNHAAAMGGNATDGCGEFMPSGEPLTCSACGCHRNFHRKEIDGDQHQQMMMMMIPHGNSQFYPPTTHANFLSTKSKKVILGSNNNAIPFSRSVLPINMAYQVGGQSCMSVPSDHSDDHHHGINGGLMVMKPHDNHNYQVVKKRFRTKFSPEQKEKMLEFAERVGWKIQRQEEGVVQQFCQQIGVKRRVLKVWMHNNKHHLAKKSNIISQQDNNNDINNNNSSSTM